MFWESEGKDDDDEEYQDGCDVTRIVNMMIATIAVKTTVRGKILAILWRQMSEAKF